VITLLLTHLDAAGVAASLRQYPDGAERVVVCHGGRREDFEQVGHDRKLFVEDPSLRGPIEQQSYAAVLRQAWHEAGVRETDLIHLVEYDHIVLRHDYERALRRVHEHSGADFLGKNCSRRDDTNWPHSLRARSDPRMRRYRELWGCLGTGMLFTRDALRAVAEAREVPGYLELAIPTLLRAEGLRLDDVDRFSDLYAHVNAPPEKDLAALRAARSAGHFFIHPFKRVDVVAPD
jgi:hypothetical protein